jgi:hypothetical protein
VWDDDRVLDALFAREGRPTLVELENGDRWTVWNIVVGQDLGDSHHHMTTNIRPRVPGADVTLIFTNKIARMSDAETGESLYSK